MQITLVSSQSPPWRMYQPHDLKHKTLQSLLVYLVPIVFAKALDQVETSHTYLPLSMAEFSSLTMHFLHSIGALAVVSSNSTNPNLYTTLFSQSC